MKKKTLVMLISAALVVATAAMGTIAYLTDTSAVTNTFTVGKVDIVVKETLVNAEGQPVDTQGNLIDASGTPVMREEGNAYHLMPGQTYTKDPTLTVQKGSEESYVRMLVTVTDIANVKAAFGPEYVAAEGYFQLEKLVKDWDSAIWPCVSITAGTESVIDPVTGSPVTMDTATYEFRYHKTVKGATTDASGAEVAGDNQLEPLFTAFTIPGTVEGEALDKLQQMEIRIVGNAIQAAGFADAAAAWNAFPTQTTP